LTAKGIEQAQKTGLLLADEHIDIIFSSDLKRCVDTAQIILKFIPECPLYLTADLREQQQNSLNGRKVDEVDWDNLPPDVENEFQMSQRAKKILSQTYQQYSDKTVLFVTHKRFENILINLLLNKDHSDKSDLEKIKNSSVSVFEVNENLEGVPVVLHTISHI
jgi:broad specificity phosphatase PhoE